MEVEVFAESMGWDAVEVQMLVRMAYAIASTRSRGVVESEVESQNSWKAANSAARSKVKRRKSLVERMQILGEIRLRSAFGGMKANV